MTTKMATQLQPKPPVPVVGHVITDEEMGLKKGIKIQQVNFVKVIKLLTDPHSVALYERHNHALQRLIRHYSAGFLLKDLVQVFKILNVCADRSHEQPMYIKPMIEMLKLCSLPFLREKSSDETTYSQIVIESFSQLGYLMRVPSREVRIQLANTLEAIYTNNTKGLLVQDHQPTTRAYNAAMVERSDIAETLVKSLTLLENDLEVKLRLMIILQHFSSFSPINCNSMLSADAASRICSRMNDPDPSGKLLFHSIEILWNLMENGDREEMARQLNSFICVEALKDAFTQQMTNGYSHYDRQLRNDLLVLTTLAVANNPEAPFIETGYAKVLILFATFQEVRSHNALVKYLKLGTSPEDFELKKMLINVLVVLSKEPAVIPLLSEGHVILALLSFIKNNENSSQPQEWSPAQFEETQLHAMSALCTLAPLCIQDYMTCQGNTRLLLLLEWCVGKDDFAGHGNAFHGKGGRGNKRAQMRYCLHLMRSVVSLNDSEVNQDLVDQGAINQLLDILLSATRSSIEDDAIDVEMQCDMLFILSVLCESNIHRKELYGEKGVEVVLRYLRTDAKKLNRGLGHHRLMLAAVDNIWCCVIGAYINEDQFLEGQGVFLLIDLLESSTRNTHNLSLGCLTDLCENPKTVPHLMAWKGKKERTIASLLVDIWRQEETHMGVKRDENGVLIDPAVPLMGSFQEEAGIKPLPANQPSHAITDISENMRAKIYALFCKIGSEDPKGLSTEEQVTLVIIRRFLDFKEGEIWVEITSELEQENLRPVTPDQELLEMLSKSNQEMAETITEEQNELLESQRQQALLEEQELYSEIKENHKQREKSIKKWDDFVARTSNYAILKNSKGRQDVAIDDSRAKQIDNEHSFHDIDLPSLQTTTFQGRTIMVDSTPRDILDGSTLITSHTDAENNLTLSKHASIAVS
ncbi:cilia- and flagella-associated protein 69 [Strongylocentrotus purpuratus]|uniref:Cilia- and flagella-associated protein 69 ARM repeats domain-containing protein n=1 Tax=Strongylocentrotus purpuratus TaxID=7668 RepID=A0A7M7PF06_STRPU|nr:cilia- and flagella-associated protein 69 [Strongylocentrotus purpuratus]|eukprot:XP_011682215.1 PREDICTED: cilia- and flagella-associated protein 69 [Strongylocentrotus purpuratus]